MHADLLKLDVLKISLLEESEARAQKHRHDIETKLIGQTSLQELLGDARAPNHGNRFVPGGGRCLRPLTRRRR